MSFKVATFADEVDEAYILKALKFAYRGRNYSDNFSPKLVKVLLSDYKKKVKNLAWFFKDKEGSGRIRNYVTLSLDPATVLDNAKHNNRYIKDMCQILETMGATYTPEQFLANRCEYKKQTQRISHVMMERVNVIPFTMPNYNGGSWSRIRYGARQVKKLHQVTEDSVIEYTDDTQTFIENIIPFSELKLEINDAFSGYDKENFAKVIGDLSASDLTASMDLVDIITCSTGNCSSCLSIDNIHAAGPIQYFRTEFSIITFTASANDRFKKMGRSWLFLRVTERGHMRDLPFWKQQKAYGSVTSNHQEMIREFTRQQAKTITSKQFSSDSFWNGYVASPNVTTSVSGAGQTSAPGYIDSKHEGNFTFMIAKGSRELRNCREQLLPFADMVDLQGEISNITSFHKSYNEHSYYGAGTGNIFLVTCEVTKEQILDTDAVEIDGKWYKKDILGQLIAGKPTDIIKETAAVSNDVIEDTNDYGDIDLDEDEF